MLSSVLLVSVPTVVWSSVAHIVCPSTTSARIWRAADNRRSRRTRRSWRASGPLRPRWPQLNSPRSSLCPPPTRHRSGLGGVQVMAATPTPRHVILRPRLGTSSLS